MDKPYRFFLRMWEAVCSWFLKVKKGTEISIPFLISFHYLYIQECHQALTGITTISRPGPYYSGSTHNY